MQFAHCSAQNAKYGTKHYRNSASQTRTASSRAHIPIWITQSATPHIITGRRSGSLQKKLFTASWSQILFTDMFTTLFITHRHPTMCHYIRKSCVSDRTASVPMTLSDQGEIRWVQTFVVWIHLICSYRLTHIDQIRHAN